MDMMVYIGVCLVIASFSLGVYGLFKLGPHIKHVVWFCVAFGFLGSLFVVGGLDRAIELSIKGLGTIKGYEKQAALSAEKAKEIVQQIENQSAAINSISKQATNAETMIKEVTLKNTLADKKITEINDTLQEASKSLTNIQSLTEFTTVVLNAQNDDREAFDKLSRWASDKSYSFSKQAKETWISILNKHNPGMYSSHFKVAWPEEIDPTKLLTIKDVRRVYETAPSHIKPAFIEYIWENKNDISKKDRIEFLVYILQNDKNLTAVEYAGRYFAKEYNLKIKPIAVDNLLDSWKNIKDKYK